MYSQQPGNFSGLPVNLLFILEEATVSFRSACVSVRNVDPRLLISSKTMKLMALPPSLPWLPSSKCPQRKLNLPQRSSSIKSAQSASEARHLACLSVTNPVEGAGMSAVHWNQRVKDNFLYWLLSLR